MAEAAEASGAPAAATRPGTPAAEPLLNRIFAPLALILSILSLVLYGLLRLSLGRTLRELRRASPPASRELTAAQRQYIEEVVAQRVAAALRDARLPSDLATDADQPS